MLKQKFLAIIDSLRKEGISERELEKVKIHKSCDFIHRPESSSELASLYGSYYAKGDITPLLEYEDQINALKKNDILHVVKTYFIPQTSTTVILRKD